jgi:shikimate dehydrogenase
MNKFAVLGHPVAHSLSPVMHMANFASLKYDGVYEKFDVEPERLLEFVRTCQKQGYLGLNITVPHKVAIIEILDEVDESVEKYGACNTLHFLENGKIRGYNTDVKGFFSGLESANFNIEGKNVFILGCGGAGSALAAASVYGGAKKIAVADLKKGSASSLAEKLGKINRSACVNFIEPLENCDLNQMKSLWSKAASDADLVVNATPIGLHEGDSSALSEEAFHEGQFVLDIVPTKKFPPTAALAKSKGAIAMDGLDFLVGQGAKSFEIWTGIAADRNAMLEAVRR